MSVDSPITGVTGVGGFGGGAATVVAELANTGHSLAIGVVTALTLIALSAVFMRRAHRNIAE